MGLSVLIVALNKNMKIEAGKFYKIRDGEKVKIYEVYGHVIHGVYQDAAKNLGCWLIDGKKSGLVEYPDDIVDEWEDPIDFDISCLPAWANWITRDCEGWSWFDAKPHYYAVKHEWQSLRPFNGLIPHNHIPKGSIEVVAKNAFSECLWFVNKETNKLERVKKTN